MANLLLETFVVVTFETFVTYIIRINKSNIVYMLSRSQQYYIDNKERIKEKSLKYYHDNKEARQKYNNEYWTEHKHKYLEQRKYDKEYKYKQKEYYQIYKNKPKVNVDHSRYYKNKKLAMILKNHKPQPLILSHTVIL